MKVLARLALAITSLVFTQSVAFAKGTTLIELKGGKPTAALAKSWKKAGEGKMDFTLDTAAEVGPGKKLTPGMVKSSLEEKLSGSGVKVTAKGTGGVSVSYTGAEKDFLEKISKTRIKAGGGDVEVALEGGGSEGGIRAKTTDRPPGDGEVKGVVVSATATSAEIRVSSASKTGESSKVSDGSKIKITLPANTALKKGETVFVKPSKLNGDTWDVGAVSKQ